MAKDETPGLLSKVVKFVRNPTTDWANLSEPEPDRESTYSKQQLKEMIERKRRNDFVRRREFDQLRKLRSREVHGVQDLAERPSFFQSSLTSRPSDDRAGTLKKIDEIEEQMSQQWWKTHKESSQASGAVPNSTGRGSIQAYALTEAAELGGQSAGSQDAVLPAGDLPLGAFWNTADAPGSLPGLALGETPIHGAAPAVAVATVDPVFVHAPELEEAAIRFANGDMEGAEANLQDLLGASADTQHVWMALFDLYRATGQQQRFETAALDFAVRYDRLAPLWLSFPDMMDALAHTPLVGRSDLVDTGFTWSCPGTLGVHAVGALSGRLAHAPQPWRLDWTALKSIDEAALEGLTDLFVRWSAMPAQLRFIGDTVLLELLREKTPSGDTAVAQAWWRLRMEVLRTTGQAETFDLTALEYCVTYEVSPPSWIDVRCHYAAGEEGHEPEQESFVGVLPSEFMSTLTMQDGVSIWGVTQTPAAAMAELAGQVTGDASDALTGLEACAQNGVLVVVCDKLARVDFSAAGSILNWVAARQADGCQVVFLNLHRLVAIFFNVIGINEHAKVLPRKD